MLALVWFVPSCRAEEPPPAGAVSDAEYRRVVVEQDFQALTPEQRLAVAQRAVAEISGEAYNTLWEKDKLAIQQRILLLGKLKAEAAIPRLIELVTFPWIGSDGRVMDIRARTYDLPAAVALKSIGPKCLEPCYQAMASDKTPETDLVYLVWVVASVEKDKDAALARAAKIQNEARRTKVTDLFRGWVESWPASWTKSEPGEKGDGSLFPALADKPPVPPLAEKAPESAAGEADPFGEHLRALRAKVPEGFTIVPEPPFVVIGDEEPAMVRRRARETVRWAVQRLKALYFEKDPEKILDIWLFKDDASYERHAREIFGDDPTTPFGYFSQTHGALIMNIRTGGGTLVHELVHPFMAANFPECPAWFNEGLGSLYEQSAERDGQIVGLTNWRLKGLQETIRAGKAPSFKALTATSDHQFYNEDKGTHYAQARYLCYWLQEKGLLAKFYREFRAGVKEDPTGYETLKRVLGEEDMDAFKKRWEAFVLGLRFP